MKLKINNSKTKIAVVIPRYHPIFGGAENQCKLLNRYLREIGDLEIPILVTKRIKADLKKVEFIEGIRVTRLGFPGISLISEYFFYIRAFIFLLFRGKDYDLIHCHATSVIGFIMTVLGTLINKKTILKLSTNGELFLGLGVGEDRTTLFRRFKLKLRKIIALYTASHAHIVALNDEGIKELLAAGARWPTIIPNGVDTSLFYPIKQNERNDIRNSLGFTEEDVVLLFSGRFVQRKGLHLLLDAFCTSRDLIQDQNIHLCLVGSSDLQEDSMSNVILEYKRKTPRIHSLPLPYKEQIVTYLHSADLFVFPSLREGMPNSVLEALAVNLPCLVSNISPHIELGKLNPSATMFYFESNNMESLRVNLEVCILKIKNSKNQNLNLPFLDQRFYIKQVAQQYSRLYKRTRAVDVSLKNNRTHWIT